jgi:3-oxoacyl-[acyl-carrier-protein] synthase II
MIRLGYSDAMLAGGTEACVTKLAIAGFSRMKALSKSANVAEASRPFDKDRDGFVIAEGASALVLEELSNALSRKAPILAELVGYGVSGDAMHVSSPPMDGDGAARAMLSALTDAQLVPADVGYINAHATSTPVGDAVEATAIAKVFGSSGGHRPLVSSTKGATGHLLGAAGAIEAAFTVLSLKDDAIPPTKGLVNPDNVSINLVMSETLRGREIRYGMSNSFGFGGTNSSLIFKKFLS